MMELMQLEGEDFLNNYEEEVDEASTDEQLEDDEED